MLGGCGCRAVCPPVLLPGDAASEGPGRFSLFQTAKRISLLLFRLAAPMNSTSNHFLSPFFPGKSLGQATPPSMPIISQSETKNPRINQLSARWQQVWLLALERQRKLNDALDRLEEVTAPGCSGQGGSWEFVPREVQEAILNQCCPRQFLLPSQKCPNQIFLIYKG